MLSSLTVDYLTMTVEDRSGEHIEEIQYHLKCLQNANSSGDGDEKIQYLKRKNGELEDRVESLTQENQQLKREKGQFEDKVECLTQEIDEVKFIMNWKRLEVRKVMDEGIIPGVYKGSGQGQSTTEDGTKTLSLFPGFQTQRTTSLSPTNILTDAAESNVDSGAMQSRRPKRSEGNSLQRKLSHDNTSLDGSHSGNPDSAFQEEKVSLDQQDSELGDGTNTPSSTSSEIRGLPQQPAETRRDYNRRSCWERVRLEEQRRPPSQRYR